MKILHITASYKPAYIYGGPVMSVAKLCEEVQAESERLKAEGEGLKAESPKTEDGGNSCKSEDRGPQPSDRGREYEDGSLKIEVQSPKTEDGGPRLGDRQLETGNWKLKTDNRSPKTEDRGPQSGDRQLKTNNPELATGNRQPATDTQQPATVHVYTTLANGKEELPYLNGEAKIINGVKITYFKRITKDHSHFSPALLGHLWRTVKQYDVVHIHAWWNLVTMPACLIALVRGVKVILSPRGTLSLYSFEKDKSQLKRLFHYLLGKKLLNACYFHTTSTKEARDTATLLKPKAIFNIPNFVNLPWEKMLIKKEKEDPILKLIFLSRIEEKKGLELLFDVLKELNFPWELSIVGDGEEEYVERLKLEGDRGPKSEDRSPKTEDRGPQSGDRQLATGNWQPETDDGLKTEDRGPQSEYRQQLETGNWQLETDKTEDGGPQSEYRQQLATGNWKLETDDKRPKTEDPRLGGEYQNEILRPDNYNERNLPKRIHWLGPVYGDEKFNLLAAHDLFVLPSYDENFANVVIESLYCGTPVLITENVGLSAYVKEKNLGWVCQRSTTDLKASLLNAYEIICKNEISASRLQNTIRKDYEEGNIIQHYQSMYHQIMIH